MKKMKKSLKYVLISLSLVLVFAVATVATVLLTRKPSQNPKVVQFTEKQMILLNQVSQNNVKLKNETSKEFSQATELYVENNLLLSEDDVYAYYNGYFVAFDESGNKLVYVNSNGQNVNVLALLKQQQKVNSQAQNISAHKIKNNLLLYSYEFESNQKLFKAYEIVDFSNLSNLKVKNFINFEVVDDQYYCDEYLIENLKINLYDDYFEISYDKFLEDSSYADEQTNKFVKDIYVYGNNNSKQTFEYQSSLEIAECELKSADNNVIVQKLANENALFVYKNKTSAGDVRFFAYTYETDKTSSYAYYPTNIGVFIEKKSIAANDDADAVLEDGIKYNYSYQFYNISNLTLNNYNLPEGVVKAEFKSVNDFIVIFEQTKNYLTLSKLGKICYYNADGDLVLTYQASSIDSTLLYSNNDKFVTKD